ncbi:META domain-containing protein [Roseovarius gahaiensis]|uniref:META domain-containing protein n=1 Tax=Roseovarius gahaiensis TaxID=2716691 RepID=A0A967BD13_9RHOB|nr:META domain-containing protein [Roseovarius gahaiensis]NHQ75772.1 META domain-containing protein [Roseovarius gahaiensis]
MKLVLTALFTGFMMMISAGHAETITGRAVVGEPVAAPPDAHFVALLQDTSVADAPAIELGRYETENADNPPYHFEIQYDPGTIKSNHTYTVRASLLSEEEGLLFTTDTHVPVITHGAPKDVEIIMKRVARMPDETISTVGAHGLRLPASFTGTLPCADCAGIEYHLDLWPDQIYHMRRVYLGVDDSPDDARGYGNDELGQWYADPANDKIILFGAAEMPLHWEVKGPDRLRKTDIQGNPIESELNYDLTSDGDLVQTDLQGLFLLGQMTYMADAAIFRECVTGRSYPIAQEGEYRALERAYLDDRDAPGASLTVHVEGSLLMRPAMEGPDRRSLVVDRFIQTRPGVSCEPQRTKADLTNTYWRIDKMRGESIKGLSDRREPHLVLQNESSPRFRATAGCNWMSGSYERHGNRLTFGPAAGTRMACPAPLGRIEDTLAQTLGAVREYRITGNNLTFLDGKGEVIAIFSAVYFR